MPDRPNLLVIMSDQHQPEALSGLGHAGVRTPALDRLMDRGLTCTSAYCNAPICTPARASFLTGLLTPQHGVWGLSTPVRTAEVTFAHVLRRAGYRTVYVGRHHFIGPDVVHGFARLVPRRKGYNAPSTHYNETRAGVMIDPVRASGPTDAPEGHEAGDLVRTECAVRELERLAAEDTDDPWAMMLGFYLPHFPYRVSRPWFDAVPEAAVPMPRTPPDERSFEAALPAQLASSRRFLGLTSDGLDEADVRRARRAYCGMIGCLDAQIGRVLDALEATGQHENTWILYLSDHGDTMGEHGLWSKCTFYEDSVRVPWILVPPGGRSPARCAHPVSQVDWMPTVLALAGESGWGEALPGRSLLSLVDDPRAPWPERAVLADYGYWGAPVPVRMVRRGRWKATFALHTRPVLFDLEADPYEWHDLGAEPNRRTLIQSLYEEACTFGWRPDEAARAVAAHRRRMHYLREAYAHTELGPTRYGAFVEGADA